MNTYNELYDRRYNSRLDGRIGTVLTWLAFGGLVLFGVAYAAGKILAQLN